MTKQNLRLLSWSTILLAGSFGCNRPSTTDQHKTWRDYGGGPDQSKFVEVDEINKSNVNKLEVAWFYPTSDNKPLQFNPLIVDNVMYVLAKNSSLVAIDATSGKELWIHANLQGIAIRGLNYWESKDGKDRRIIFQMNNYLQEIDANTGKSILSFGNKGLVDLKQGLGRDAATIPRIQSQTPGKVFENLVLLGAGPGENYLSAPGFCRAYDVITGKLAWTFHTIPQPGEFGYDTWPKDAYKYVGGVNTWGEISVDAKRGIAYFPLGSPTYDFFGGDRKGSNLFGNSLLALDARTGKRLWHFQLVHHDLFDYDFTAAPQLITVNHDGKQIDAVALAGKNGSLYAFDRVTGKPLWPIEERPVPASDVPGEEAWPTQPFQTVLPPFSRQSLVEDDMEPQNLTPEQTAAWNAYMSPEERQGWKKRLSQAGTGLYRPLSINHETATMPGAHGGATYGGTASNPEKGMVYVLNQSYVSIFDKLDTRENILKKDAALAGAGSPLYVNNCQSCHGADRAGLVGPSLLNLNMRLQFSDFTQLVHTGRGEMPAFPQMDEDKLRTIYKYITAGSAGGRPIETSQGAPTGPVVDSGGAPGGRVIRQVAGFNGRWGGAYPSGVDTPAVRYYSEGYGFGFPYLMSPPWSEIVAYDMNQGTIKWRMPLGKNAGGENTGVPHGVQRCGMIVTSSGIVFSTAKDGYIYAFDADNGKELWAGKLPFGYGTEGMPAMYEANGRFYLVVTATVPVVYEGIKTKWTAAAVKESKRGYIAFALPE